ncbi:MAG: aminotransferase class IV [Brevinematales bacterium]|nr:aminotransferase class IV [Brevinematales bacterium]
MYQLVESICLKDCELQNIDYHNKRFNNSRKQLFGINDNIDLREKIKITPDLKKFIYKVRVIYSEEIEKIEFQEYFLRKRETLKLVFSDEIDYSFKYLDRQELENLLNLKEKCDDILIVKNNRPTDTFASNIVFFDGEKWFTPAFPLLMGTKRQYLIDNGLIFEEDILLKDINIFKGFKLINAMLDWENPILPISNIEGL